MQMSINYLFALLKFRVSCANVSLHTRSKIVDQTVCALDWCACNCQYKLYAVSAKEEFTLKQQTSVVYVGSVAMWSACPAESLSGGPRFESRSDHYLDLFLGSPEFESSATLVKANWFASGQLGFLTVLCSVWIISFSCFLVPLALS